MEGRDRGRDGGGGEFSHQLVLPIHLHLRPQPKL